MKKNCLICGKQFYTKPYLVDKRITCSRKCQGKWQSENLIGKSANHYTGGKVKIVCKNCGKEFNIIRSMVEVRKYCSKKCYYAGRSKYLAGENANNYKGGEILSTDSRGKNRLFVRNGAGSRITFARRKVELIIGRKLNKNEVVHHIDENKMNDANNNLLLCDAGYHSYLHWRMKKRIFPNAPGNGI